MIASKEIMWNLSLENVEISPAYKIFQNINKYCRTAYTEYLLYSVHLLGKKLVVQSFSANPEIFFSVAELRTEQ